MWSIDLALENDFEGLTDCEYLLVLPGLRILTNLRYFLNFPHDRNDGEFVEKYTRRIQRFRDLLKSGGPLLFVRVQEDEYDDRIRYPQYERYMEQSEEEYLLNFSKRLQNLDVRFRIIYINRDKGNFNDVGNHILYLIGNVSMWNRATRDILELLCANADLVTSCS